MNISATVYTATMEDGTSCPAVQFPDGRRFTRFAIEMPNDMWASTSVATDEHYQAAAELARRRLRRCSPGSDTYWWYRAVIEENNRRRKSRLTLISGGSS